MHGKPQMSGHGIAAPLPFTGGAMIHCRSTAHFIRARER
jgi:hypothetical protein